MQTKILFATSMLFFLSPLAAQTAGPVPTQQLTDESFDHKLTAN